MRKEKELITLLRGLVDLLRDEAGRNPAFANRLEELFARLPERSRSARVRSKQMKIEQIPDIYAEFKERGDSEFGFWLRAQPIAVLRAIIRQHDFDSNRRTAKWKDPEKLAAYIADQLQSRMTRGSGFLRGGSTQ